VPSMVAFVPPVKPVRIYLVSWLSHRSLASLAVRAGFAMFDADLHGIVSWLSHRSLASLAVRAGFAMFDADRHGKKFVAARMLRLGDDGKVKRRGGRSSHWEFRRHARCGFPR
jgi:hypothetical protein